MSIVVVTEHKHFVELQDHRGRPLKSYTIVDCAENCQCERCRGWMPIPQAVVEDEQVLCPACAERQGEPAP